MFEQSLYEYEPVATPTQAGDLFHDYEIKNWVLTPRLYKILGISALANILVIVIAAQTSLLTAKGCDSPLVGNVCQVLDTVVLGTTLLFGSKRDYVDVAYNKTELADADITFVDMTGDTGKLYYPADYLKYSDPERYAQQQEQANVASDGFVAAGVPITSPSFGNSLVDTPPTMPKPNPNVVQGPLPTFNSSPRTSLKMNRKGRPGDAVKPDVDDTAANSNTDKADKAAEAKADPNKKIEPTPPDNPYEINKRPFVDLANNVNDLLDKKQVKLESAFVVNASGKLTKDGKLDPKSFRWGQIASQDQKMIDVVKEAISAINDSGYLKYLKDISGKDFNLMLQQDDVNISAVVQSEMETDTRAKSISSSLSLLMAAAKMKKNGADADQNDKDDLILLNNARVETDGKKVIIKFLVPKEIALPMIQRKLAEQKAQPKQPSGIATGKATDNTAIK